MNPTLNKFGAFSLFDGNVVYGSNPRAISLGRLVVGITAYNCVLPSLEDVLINTYPCQLLME